MSKTAKFITETLSDVDMSKLGPRSRLIFEIVTEISFVSQNLSMLVRHVVEPLQIMSKGVTGSRNEEKFYQKSR